MKSNFEKFRDLHHGPDPLLIGNVWNVQSARVYEQKKFGAIATSSAAVAETLGYADGEQMSFDEYFFVIARIAKTVSLPLSVDLEAGYGRTTSEIVGNIGRLNDLGVAGINIEDSIVVSGKRTIVDPNVFTARLREITAMLKVRNIQLFINVRCDSFLLGISNAVEDALARMALYQQCDVHGLFFPCISRTDDIVKITRHSRLPVNVMCFPGLPDFEQLKAAGVKRISMGNFLNRKIYEGLGERVDRIVHDRVFDSLFS